ncbi:MAG: hypothetical protein Q7U70_02810 [Methylotenera sp.]|nr:hypothetical protein [Methylotenera sp.]MDP2402453.1 hypothetical protein [Methylotenera sp.]MDZ4222340.1 hypothetical protein [Methylotenera sp.]
MKNFNPAYGYWLLSKFAKNLGLWGLLGVTAIVGSLLFYMTEVATMERELNLTLTELEFKKDTKAVLAEPKITPAQTTEQELIDFYQMFPVGASLPTWLSLINEVAQKQHLTLNRGDYKLSQTKQGQLLRYEIVLPVVGKYAEIRQLIVELLHKLPALAVSELQIKRENSLSPTVEARLVFVLFLQGDTW